MVATVVMIELLVVLAEEVGPVVATVRAAHDGVHVMPAGHLVVERDARRDRDGALGCALRVGARPLSHPRAHIELSVEHPCEIGDDVRPRDLAVEPAAHEELLEGNATRIGVHRGGHHIDTVHRQHRGDLAEQPGAIDLDDGEHVTADLDPTSARREQRGLFGCEDDGGNVGHRSAAQHVHRPSDELRDGYLAKSREEELSMGPGSRVFVTTSVTEVTDAIRGNPHYDGGPVRLVSCHTGTVDPAAGVAPAAQQVADALGVPVMAPTNAVGVNRYGPLGQVPQIRDGGTWEVFQPGGGQ